MSDLRTPNLDALASKESFSWTAPFPLEEHAVPNFPLDILPGWLREFVAAESTATQTPSDLCGMLVLSALSTACARKFRVAVKDGYEEPVNLFLVVVLGPGNRKSTVFSHVVRPIQDFEEAWALSVAPQIAEQKARREIKEIEIATAKRQSAESGPAQLEKVLSMTRELSEIVVPKTPRLLVDDCTPERLSSILAEQEGRIGILSPEGGVFEIIGGRYSGSGTPNLNVYLMGHAGDSLRVDREKDKDNPTFLKNPALTFGLAVQPDVVRSLNGKPGFHGRGLLGRFLYSMPHSLLGARSISPPTVPSVVFDLYRINISKLLNLPWNSSAEDKNTHHYLNFSAEARTLIDYFGQCLEPKLASLAELGDMPDWAGKLVGAVIRISGLLHLAQNVDDPFPWEIPIDETTVNGAIKLGEYLIPHARAAYLFMETDQNIQGAKRILNWLGKTQVDSFHKQVLWQATKGYFKKADSLNMALKVLVEHGHIRELDGERRIGPGRKSAPFFEVNPIWRSSNSYNSYDSSNFRNSRMEVEAHV